MSDSRSDAPIDEHATGALPVAGGDTAKLDLSQIRRDYAASNLRRAHLDDDPIRQFGSWMHEAIQSSNPEPTAMTLATLGDDGMPAARVVLLKGFDERGFRFFTNYSSRKGRELAAHPKASVCFFWPELHRQVRIEGTVERIDRDESAEYFQTRPHASQVSATASPQSQPVQDRAELERRHRDVENQYAGKEVPLPDDWGGFRLVPVAVEMWQGRTNRLHDRFRYRQTSTGWAIDRLGP